jgi:hypothetical protein
MDCRDGLPKPSDRNDEIQRTSRNYAVDLGRFIGSMNLAIKHADQFSPIYLPRLRFGGAFVRAADSNGH